MSTIRSARGRPADAAGTVAWLASDAPALVTGVNLDINGGLFFMRRAGRVTLARSSVAMDRAPKADLVLVRREPVDGFEVQTDQSSPARDFSTERSQTGWLIAGCS